MMNILTSILTAVSDILSVMILGAGGASAEERVIALIQYLLALIFFL
jgi:hypothetical protein